MVFDILGNRGSGGDGHFEDITFKTISSVTTSDAWQDAKDEEQSPLNGSAPKQRWLRFPRRRRRAQQDQTSGTVHKHGWKPETMRAPVLFAFAGASLLIAALIEIFAQSSQKNGGLSLVDSADALPTSVSFGYLYFPTIVAVVYSLIWNWIDLDVKRMQPWLELSKPDGATGRDSLFLDYPFEFVALVPFTSARRRHWAAFVAGTTVVIIFWLLTPLQSAVFGTGEVLQHVPTTMIYPSTFMSGPEQGATLDQGMFITKYAIDFLSMPYPAFTTEKFALLPFQPIGDSSVYSNMAANWTGETTMYWTDLKCWSAEVQPFGRGIPGTASFLNGQGCNVSTFQYNENLPTNTPYSIMYVGYQPSPYASQFLSSPTCGNEAWHQFLATWSRFNNGSNTVDTTALFCEPSYFKQRVSVSVTAATSTPLNDTIKPLAPAEVLQASEFNISSFEYVLNAANSPIDKIRDFPFTQNVEFYPRLQTMGLWYPLDPMIGPALGAQNYTVEEYSNSTILASTFEAAHKSMFSIAMNQILLNSNETSQSLGLLTYVKYGVIVSRLFSAIIEGTLVLIAGLAMTLFCICHRCRSNLSSDPAPLGSLITLLRDSTDLRTGFSGQGNKTSQELLTTFGSYRFRLNCGCQSGVRPNHFIEVCGRSEKKSPVTDSVSEHPSLTQTGHYSPMKPLALRRESGAIFCLLLIAALVVLIYLNDQAQKYGGLSQPSSSFEVNLLLTSYIPTAFSTLVEPFWVMLNRFLCVLQPFRDLERKNTAQHRSLKARYTAVPPQLAVWEALKSHHWLLAIVCVIALLANLLAVGLGGLFNEVPVIGNPALNYTRTRKEAFSNNGINQFATLLFQGIPSTYEDAYYVAMTNLTSGAPLPPWTTPDFFFFPVNHTSATDLADEHFQASTTGVGIAPSCYPVGPISSVNVVPTFNASIGLPGGSPPGCPKVYRPRIGFNYTGWALPSGPSANEFLDTMSTSVHNFTVTTCDKTFIFGWSRANIQDARGEMNTSLLMCHPVFRTASFNVSFDDSGHILDSVRTGSFSSSFSHPNSTFHFETIINHINHFMRPVQSAWHNDTISRDWLNYLLVKSRNTTDTLNPDYPMTDVAALARPVAALYSMMFAIFVSLNPYLFEAVDAVDIVPGSQQITETKILVSSAAFMISTSILALYILTAAGFYIRAVKFFLPSMPTTIGSLVAFIAPSRLAEQQPRISKHDSDTLGFGRYVGLDGRAQIGIEFADFVVPIKVSALEKGDTKPAKNVVMRAWKLFSSRDQGNTWL